MAIIKPLRKDICPMTCFFSASLKLPFFINHCNTFKTDKKCVCSECLKIINLQFYRILIHVTVAFNSKKTHVFTFAY